MRGAQTASRSRAARLAGSLVILLAGCAEQAAPEASFQHYPALRDGLARVEAELAAEAAANTTVLVEVEAEHVAGLVHMLANSTGRTRDLPLEEIGTLGDGATPLLAALAAKSDGDANQRLAACELLARLGTPLAAEHLLQLCEKDPASWIRAQAAWRLGEVEADWAVGRLLLRLKYEVDEETAIWIASTLSAQGNHSGLDTLWRLERQATTAELRARAGERLTSLAVQAGIDDPVLHGDLWARADPERRLYREAPSARLRQVVWGSIEMLSGEHFQLRGVDDARFVLSRMGAWVTDPLCQALHDEDVYVRVHAAQCIERMGPRGVDAGPALLQALDDPTLAGDAAAALGAIADPAAEPVLRRLLGDTQSAHELRVACAASLGRLGLGDSAAALTAVTKSTAPLDLRQTSANALVALGLGNGVASFLRDLLVDPLADRPAAEATLERWMRTLESEASRQLLEAWLVHAPPPGIIHTADEARARIAARHKLLVEVGELPPGA